jgi:hypothetical protein
MSRKQPFSCVIINIGEVISPWIWREDDAYFPNVSSNIITTGSLRSVVTIAVRDLHVIISAKMTVVCKEVWNEGCLIPLCRMKKTVAMECCEKIKSGQTGRNVLSAFMSFSNNIHTRTRSDWRKSVRRQLAIDPKSQTFLSEMLRPLLSARAEWILVKESHDFLYLLLQTWQFALAGSEETPTFPLLF